MNEVQQKQLALLNETVAHYNANNLCMVGSKCQYAPIENRSAGCAIGRKLPLELAQQLDNDFTFHKNIGSGVSNSDLFDLLPDELKELGSKFLTEVQMLHDRKANWNEDGLNESGKIAVSNIKRIFGLTDEA